MDLSPEWNAEYIESRYLRWKADPNSVSRDWQWFFSGFELATSPEGEAAGVCDKRQVLLQSRVDELIHRYRDLGHLLACLDPLAACPSDHPLLNLAAFQLTAEDLQRIFYTRHLGATEQATLRDILQMLRETYCRSVGVEYMHLQDPTERRWLQERMEPVRNHPPLDRDSKLSILHKLTQATLFEQFLHTKYVGQKRFSLEGAEALVAMLDALVQHEAQRGCREIILGMAHRGRLNVQVNVLGKLYEEVFCEFEDNYDPQFLVGGGDVKYHKGYMADVVTAGPERLRFLLVDNPSHVESINPVVEGIARARQEQLHDQHHRLVLPLLIHGDAAFAGQGVVAETLNLSQLQGYHTGGTLHLVINNQIGFTTLPEDARSTRYSTDIAKMLMVPIFHVHGEDPEALLHVMRLACEYRLAFAKDVVIDVLCYRRYGHNEGDEPYYTQPRMYERIKDRPPLYQMYSQRLIDEGLINPAEVQQIKQGVSECLERALTAARAKTCSLPAVRYFESWEGVSGDYSHASVATGVNAEALVSLARRLHHYPAGFAIHPKLQRILKRRLESIETGSGIDWATAEMLAFATLLVEGKPVRLSGEDSRRGTFSQRHGALVDIHTGEQLIALNTLDENQAPFSIYDSMLSENAVLGFEYGYSLAAPHALTLWEAQFGDFANGAQVVIDQYIVSGQSKWSRLSGLVLLLPHGYEGQGGEHSSARLERFLQMCAEDNLQVCYPTSPAQYFHLLRRQVLRNSRKPLVVMTPKSLLRHALAVSTREELATGHFQEVLDDPQPIAAAQRVVWCSGKIYYDLVQRRQELQRTDVAILRLEQFYPFPEEPVAKLLSRHATAREWLWVQEEPANMGGWDFVQPRLRGLLGRDLEYLGRPPGASPATGYIQVHRAQQAAILERTFAQ